MATNYVLVDFENVQPDLSALAGTAHRVIVFVGAKQQSSRHHYDKFDSLLELGANLERVKVPYSGKNALDMHIAFQIGRISEKDPGASFLILSRDTDFDPLIEYLKARGVTIARAKDVSGMTKAPMPTVPESAAVAKKGKESSGTGGVRKAQSRPAKPQQAKAQQLQPRSQQARARQPRSQQPRSQEARPQPPSPQQSRPQQQKAQAPKSHPAPRPQPEVPPPPVLFDQIVKQLRSMRGKPSTRQKLEQTIASYFKHHGGEKPELVQQTIEALIGRGLVVQAGARVSYSLD